MTSKDLALKISHVNVSTEIKMILSGAYFHATDYD